MDKNLDFFTPTITMHIASPKIKDDCSNVKNILRKLGVMGNITPNKTLTPVEENGCKIVFQGPMGLPVRRSVSYLWDSMHTPFELSCARVEVKFNWEGCIKDLFRKSKCPRNEN